MSLTFDNYKISLLDLNDSEFFHELIASNRRRLEDFFADTVSRTQTLNDTINYCNEIEKRIKEKSYFPYMITDTNKSKFIGLVDVKNIDWNIPKAELGLFIDSVYEGRGIISKATELVVQHIVNEHKFIKLLCRANSSNRGSIAVILKNEFEFKRTVKNDYKTTKGEMVDLNYYCRKF